MCVRVYLCEGVFVCGCMCMCEGVREGVCV